MLNLPIPHPLEYPIRIRLGFCPRELLSPEAVSNG
jgi:hypothetical protein